MDTAIRAPAEDTINGVTKTALVSDERSLKVLLPVPANRDRCSRFHFHADPDSKRTPWRNVELHCLEFVVNSFPYLSERHGFCVLDLFLGEEGVLITYMTTVRAMARGWTFDPGSWSDLEVFLAFWIRTLPPEIPVFIGTHGNFDLITDAPETSRNESPHSPPPPSSLLRNPTKAVGNVLGSLAWGWWWAGRRIRHHRLVAHPDTTTAKR